VAFAPICAFQRNCSVTGCEAAAHVASSNLPSIVVGDAARFDLVTRIDRLCEDQERAKDNSHGPH